MHVRWPTPPPRNHTVLTRRQLVRAQAQLRLEHPSLAKTNGTFTSQIIRQSVPFHLDDVLKFPQCALLTQVVLEDRVLTRVYVFLCGVLRCGLSKLRPIQFAVRE